APGRAHGADRAAVDAGGGHAGEKLAVKARVAGAQRQVAARVGGVFGRRGAVGHGQIIGLRGTVAGRFRTCASRPTQRPGSLRTGLYNRFTFADQELPVNLSPAIFKAYDSRGVVPDTVNAEVARCLGRAFGTAAVRAGERTVAVGRDGRLSGA